MGDKDTDIQVLKDKVKEFVKARDWEQYHHPKELAISLSLEASELLELFQWKEKENLDNLKKNKELISRISEEVADIMIYCMTLSNQTGIDLADAITEKLEQNHRKYPVEKAKGLNKKYTEL